MRYAVSNWIYGDEPLPETCARLGRLGFDGIELRGEPADYDRPALRVLLDRHDLRVTSICGMYPGPDGPRDLSHPDPAVRREAGRMLAHVHVADSNRQGVGRGHIDFRRLLRALVEIGYEGALALEPLPPLANPYEAMAGRRATDVAEQFARESLTLLRLHESTARPAGEH